MHPRSLLLSLKTTDQKLKLTCQPVELQKDKTAEHEVLSSSHNSGKYQGKEKTKMSLHQCHKLQVRIGAAIWL